MREVFTLPPTMKIGGARKIKQRQSPPPQPPPINTTTRQETLIKVLHTGFA
jgi:hypothetical protein